MSFFRKLPLLLASLLFFLSSQASATAVDCSYTGNYYIYLPPATINVGRDANVGDLIGSWISVSTAPAWTCFRTTTTYGTIMTGVAGYSPYTVNGTTVVDGVGYTIYNTAVKAGLGYIVRWRISYNGMFSKWQALNGTGWRAPEDLLGPIVYDNQRPFPINLDVQVQFVKTATTLTSGTVSAFDPLYVRPHHTIYDGGAYEIGPMRIVEYLSRNLTIAAGGTCTTPNVSVTFPPTLVSSFNGPGSTAGMTSFNLQLNNCPAGLNSIGYQFLPTTSLVDAVNGVVALDASSTAQGIGIQLLSGEGSILSFDTIYRLADYDSAISRSYVIPLQAALYQTATKINPGTIKSSISFTLDYK